MRQYEIWWAALPEPAGTRPVLLLTRTPAYEYLTRITIVEITSVIRGIPQEVPLGRREGLRRACVANLDNVHVIAKQRLTRRIGVVRVGRASEIKRALGYAFDWQELKHT
jgi:mRNA-degrading endonuclease toxin of MazEF toxin-antitoxin module